MSGTIAKLLRDNWCLLIYTAWKQKGVVAATFSIWFGYIIGKLPFTFPQIFSLIYTHFTVAKYTARCIKDERNTNYNTHYISSKSTLPQWYYKPNMTITMSTTSYIHHTALPMFAAFQRFLKYVCLPVISLNVALNVFRAVEWILP